MAISHTGVGADFSVTTSGTAFQLRCPADVQDGDILIAFVCWEGAATGTMTPMSGWTVLAEVGIDDGTDDWVLFITAKDGVASDASKDYTTAADGGSVSFASTRRSTKVLGYRGTAPLASQTTWVAGNVTQNAGTTGGTTQTITNPNAGSWVLGFFGAHDNTTGTWGSYGGNVSSERYELSNGGADPFIFHAVADSNTTVAAGNVNASANPSTTEDNTIVWICCIEPPAVPPIGGSVLVVKQAQIRASYW